MKKDNIINEYHEVLNNMSKNVILALDNGFVIDECNTALFAILIHCNENADIFDNNQLSNINNFTTKLIYGT